MRIYCISFLVFFDQFALAKYCVILYQFTKYRVNLCGSKMKILLRGGPSYVSTNLFLYKNDAVVPESSWHFAMEAGALNKNIGVTASRNMVSNAIRL